MIKLLRQMYKGVSWRNPIINAAFKLMDIPDLAVRYANGLLNLPRYSFRVRSRGIANQFGGKLFNEQGKFMVGLLQDYAGLQANSDVIEIGCGCGCAAIGLRSVLTAGSYRGMDIDIPSIYACKSNHLFGEKFIFDRMDIFSAQYNPEGKILASEYVFPYENKSADIVFLTSVFTHMLPDDVAQYLSEIGRVLKDGGVLMCSVFLMDDGHDGASLSFPFDRGGYRLHQETIPERAVGYYYNFFQRECAKSQMFPHGEKMLLGNWRRASKDGEDQKVNFGQDILIFQKRMI